MAMNNRHNILIPTLERDNFEDWYMLVEAYARASGLARCLQNDINMSSLNENQVKAFWHLSYAMKVSVGKELSHLVKQMSKPDEWHHPNRIIARIKREIRPHATAQ